MILELSNIEFNYGKHAALHGISLRFEGSGLISLLGPNGSGKSTLLKSINRIINSKGEVFFNNKKVNEMPVSEIASIFGYVPQSISSAFPITVFDMLLLGRKPYLGWNPSERDIDIVSENISLMGLKDFVLRQINELSGGERQKVLIATALSQEPKILLFDEPTNNLDIKHQLDVMKHIKNIVIEKQILALIAMHDLNLAAQYSDEIVMLQKGRIYTQGKPEDVMTKENIKAIYGVNVAIHNYGASQHIVPVEERYFTA